MTNLLRAASFVLCGDNIEEQLESIYNAQPNNAPIPSDVIVWEKFDWIDCAITLIEVIEDLEIQFDEANQDFVKSLLTNKTK